MGLEFINKLPTPAEIREQFPIPAELAALKEKRACGPERRGHRQMSEKQTISL